VKGRGGQHAILVSGLCEGLSIEQMRIEVPADSPKAAVFLWAGARGSAEHPIALRESRIQGGDIGLVLIGTSERPAAHVRVENCRFAGPGVLVALHDAIADVSLTRNIFVNGKSGVSVAVETPNQLRRLTVGNSTFFQLGSWLALGKSSLEQVQISIDRNLIVHCRQIDASGIDLSSIASWFHDNWWVKSEGMDEAQSAHVAVLKDLVPLLSEDPDQPDFLRPAIDVMPADKPIGALAPRKNNSD
jgi:hypothetical protein